MDGISSLSAVYFKEPEAFVKILRDSKNQRWEEMEEENDNEADMIDSTGKVMGSYQAQIQNNATDEAKNTGIDLLGGGGPVSRQTPEAVMTRTMPVENQRRDAGEVDLLSGEIIQPVPATAQAHAQNIGAINQNPGFAINNIRIPSSVVLSYTTQGVTNKNSGVQV